MNKKLFKKIMAGILAAALLCGIFMFASCDKKPSAEEPEAPAETNYKVTVKNALGAPYTSSIVVKFLQNGKQIAMQTVDENGVAAKTIATGEYTVEISETSGKALYYEEAKVTADSSEIEVVVSFEMAEEETAIFAYSLAQEKNIETTAHSLSVGSNHVSLVPNERNYFTFTPTEEGKYQFSTTSDMNIGYYGTVYYVSNSELAQLKENNVITMDFKDRMIGETGVLVLGIDSKDGATEAIFNIANVGETDVTPEDFEWEIYEAQDTIAEFVLGDEAKIKEFDLTAETSRYNLVYNSADGFYHLDAVDGPLVLVRLAEDSQYIASFNTILEDRDGVTRYFYDENGEFVRREGYNQCLLEYIECIDEEYGVYPLTKDLEYIIKNNGTQRGWWDTNSPGYIFVDGNSNKIPGINNEIGWLLMCCYAEGYVTTAVPEETEIPATDTPTADTTASAEPDVTNAPTAATTAKPSDNTSTKPTSAVTVKPSATAAATAPAKATAAATATAKPTATPAAKPTATPANTPAGDPTPAIPSKPSNKGNPVDTYPDFGTGGAESAVGAPSYFATVGGKERKCFNLYRVASAYLAIYDADAYIVYDNVVYFAENGVARVLVSNEETFAPLYLEVGNLGSSEKNFEIKVEYIEGSYENPISLTMGDFSVNIKKGNSDGVYYTFTATKNGTLTLKLTDFICNVKTASGDITITDFGTGATVQKTLLGNGVDGAVSMDVKAGSTLRIQFIATDSASYEAPDATLKINASFK